jgi:twitching motility protein PilU
MKLIEPYLRLMADKNASDIYFLTGAPPHMRVEGDTMPVSKHRLQPGQVRKLAYSIMSEHQINEFEATNEMNLGIAIPEVGRYRVNVFVQRSEASMVIRYIKSTIPSFEELNLPPAIPEMVMKQTGLVLVVGSTGSGKSTTLAAMIDHRSAKTTGHILTVEDPIEYGFRHNKALVSQREVGVDTLNYENALREAMREAPDVIMIGEIRDRETMEAAITYADTGHLCLSTLHAVNSNQALDRIINMFPTEAKNQILMDLSLNLNAIISQRLVLGKDGRRIPAIEILVNTPYVSELIKKSELAEIKEIMEKGASVGMQTFDQSLYELYKRDKIDLRDALANADSSSDLEWKINFGGTRGLNKSHEAESLELPSEIESREQGGGSF